MSFGKMHADEVVAGDERADRQLGQGDGGNERLGRKVDRRFGTTDG